MGFFKKARYANRKLNEFARLSGLSEQERLLHRNVDALAEATGTSRSEVLTIGVEAMEQVDNAQGASTLKVVERITDSLTSGKLTFSDGNTSIMNGAITPIEFTRVVHGVLLRFRPNFMQRFYAEVEARDNLE